VSRSTSAPCAHRSIDNRQGATGVSSKERELGILIRHGRNPANGSLYTVMLLVRRCDPTSPTEYAALAAMKIMTRVIANDRAYRRYAYTHPRATPPNSIARVGPAISGPRRDQNTCADRVCHESTFGFGDSTPSPVISLLAKSSPRRPLLSAPPTRSPPATLRPLPKIFPFRPSLTPRPPTPRC
jgi:hypothetical protein